MSEHETLTISVVVSRALLEVADIAQTANIAAESAAKSAREAVTKRARELHKIKEN